MPTRRGKCAQQALDEGAEIILGPLFAQSVSAVGQVARPRNVPVIAFSTDANVASNGVYLLSFLPETDVERIVQYASSTGKHSYAALIPDNPYGTVVEAAFKQAVARRNGQIVALEHYPHDKAAMAGPVHNVAQAAVRAEALFIPDGGDAVPDVVAMLVGERRQYQENPVARHRTVGRSAHQLRAGARRRLVCGAGWRGLPRLRRALPRPLQAGAGAHRDAAYDAVALIAALVKTQGTQRFSPAVLTNPSGFTGIDGLFRFRQDGTNERGLAVLRVTPTGTQMISPPPNIRRLWNIS